MARSERCADTASMEFRRTKIVATIGPASDHVRTLRALLEAGVDVVRLNFSHGTNIEKARQIAEIREIESGLGRPVAILADIQGPKIRVGLIPGTPLRLVPGQRIDLYSDGREGTHWRSPSPTHSWAWRSALGMTSFWTTGPSSCA